MKIAYYNYLYVYISFTSAVTFRDSVDGIATRYGLDGSGFKTWWGARFSATVQNVPDAHRSGM
jgi:hypothetical protein